MIYTEKRDDGSYVSWDFGDNMGFFDFWKMQLKGLLLGFVFIVIAFGALYIIGCILTWIAMLFEFLF